ncbi:hypothetical protein ACA910_015504 [Epithemia clementina (nom. ined.)]
MSTTTTTTNSNNNNNGLHVHFLDLRGSGLSILERLLLEECLLRQEDKKTDDHHLRNWIIAGTHEAHPHRYLQLQTTFSPKATSTAEIDLPIQNKGSAIVLGLGGKPHELLNTQLVQQDGCMCIKRFTGGGTVVLDADSIWTTLIFRPKEQKQEDSSVSEQQSLPELFPRPIMEWTSQILFDPLFESLGQKDEQQRVKSGNPKQNDRLQKTLVLDTKSCAVENTGRMIQLARNQQTSTTDGRNNHDNNDESQPQQMPKFSLRENDYVLDEHWKMGGNAQSITKQGWLHHTSFLWDYQEYNMQYLTLPHKRPTYRQDRSHSDFLIKLCQAYPHLSKQEFVTTLLQVAEAQPLFETVTRVKWRDALDLVGGPVGLQQWFEQKSRTRILKDLQ